MTSLRETVLCRYHYDPLDRLISHVLAETPGRQRFYCRSRLATEIQGAMRYSIVQQGDQLLAQQRSEGDEHETTLLATDQQRSVLHTLKANHPPQPIAYSPYGHRSVGSGLLSLLGFNGERPDPVTGLYLLGNGYRAFNPVLIRFNSPDSWSPFGKGGINPYTYCLGDPTNRSDPNGHVAPFINKKLKELGRSAAISVAKRTGQVHFERGVYLPIKNSSTAEQALRARDRVLELDKLTKLGQFRNPAYRNHRLNPNLNDLRPMDLKSIAANTALSTNVSAAGIPTTLQYFLVEQVMKLADYKDMLISIHDSRYTSTFSNSSKYSTQMLTDTAKNLEYNYSKRTGNLIKPEIAQAYESIMSSIRHPQHEELIAERTRLLDENFDW